MGSAPIVEHPKRRRPRCPRRLRVRQDVCWIVRFWCNVGDELVAGIIRVARCCDLETSEFGRTIRKTMARTTGSTAEPSVTHVPGPLCYLCPGPLGHLRACWSFDVVGSHCRGSDRVDHRVRDVGVGLRVWPEPQMQESAVFVFWIAN